MTFMKKFLLCSLFMAPMLAMHTPYNSDFAESMASQSFIKIVKNALPQKVDNEKKLKGLLQSLLDQGAEINAKDDQELTALMYAACNENKSLYRWLVHRGADSKISDQDGKKTYEAAPADWGIDDSSFKDEISDEEEITDPAPYSGDECVVL